MGPRKREALEGYLYLTPWAIGFVLFVAGPIITSLFLSFTKYNVIRPPEFVGLANYVTALTRDDLFFPAIGKTFYYAALVVPAGLALSLGVAMMLNRRLLFTAAMWRTFFFLPTLTPVIAAALLWRWMLNPDVGVVNYTLAQFGIKGPGWLSSTQWAFPPWR